MRVQKFSPGDAIMERSPGQDADISTGNLVDERHGGPITVGYGRYGADQSLSETMAVDDVMIVLEGTLTIVTYGESFTAHAGDIVYMPKGQAVTIRAHSEGALTAYVTWPHWRPVHGEDRDD